jgi:hypothetical protein
LLQDSDRGSHCYWPDPKNERFSLSTLILRELLLMVAEAEAQKGARFRGANLRDPATHLWTSTVPMFLATNCAKAFHTSLGGLCTIPKLIALFAQCVNSSSFTLSMPAHIETRRK